MIARLQKAYATVIAVFFVFASAEQPTCRSVLAHISSWQAVEMDAGALKEPVLADMPEDFQDLRWTTEPVEYESDHIQIDFSDPVITSLVNPIVATEAGRHIFSVSEHLEATKNQTEKRTLFAAAVHHYDLAQRVLEDFPSPQWQSFRGHDKMLYDDVFSLGPHGTGLPLHQHNLAWLQQVYGQKRFFFFSAGFDLTTLSQEAYRQAFLTPPHWWSANVRNEIRSKGSECIVLPGEVLIVPPFWYHATENVGMAFAVGGQTMGHNVGRQWSGEVSRIPIAPHSWIRVSGWEGQAKLSMFGFFSMKIFSYMLSQTKSNQLSQPSTQMHIKATQVSAQAPGAAISSLASQLPIETMPVSTEVVGAASSPAVAAPIPVSTEAMGGAASSSAYTEAKSPSSGRLLCASSRRAFQKVPQSSYIVACTPRLKNATVEPRSQAPGHQVPGAAPASLSSEVALSPQTQHQELLEIKDCLRSVNQRINQ